MPLFSSVIYIIDWVMYMMNLDISFQVHGLCTISVLLLKVIKKESPKLISYYMPIRVWPDMLITFETLNLIRFWLHMIRTYSSMLTICQKRLYTSEYGKHCGIQVINTITLYCIFAFGIKSKR